jgi:catechol-2,3-dioxygenase
VTQRECTQIRRTHLCGKVSEYKVKEILEGIMVNKIDHIGIAVKNLEEALNFYENILGLKSAGFEIVEEQKVKVALLPSGRSK